MALPNLSPTNPTPTEDQFTLQSPAVKPDNFTLTAPDMTTVPDEEVERRASEAHFALQDQSPGVDTLKQAIANGQEDQIRQQAAIQRDTELQGIKLDQVQKVVQASDKPLTPEEINGIMTAVAVRPTDKDTVLETSFARTFTTFAAFNTMDGHNKVFKDAFAYDPVETQKWLDVGASMLANQRIARKHLEDTKDYFSKLNWVAGSKESPIATVDQWMLDTVPLLNSAQAMYFLDSNLPGGKPGVWKALWQSAFGRGNNLGQKMANLWTISDPVVFNQVLDGTLKELRKENPLAALHVAEAAVAFGTNERFINNVLGLGDLATLVPWGTGIKMAKRGLGFGAKDVVKTSEEAAKDTATAIRHSDDFGYVSSTERDQARVDAALASIEKTLKETPYPATARPTPRQGEMFGTGEMGGQGDLFRTNAPPTTEEQVAALGNVRRSRTSSKLESQQATKQNLLETQGQVQATDIENKMPADRLEQWKQVQAAGGKVPDNINLETGTELEQRFVPTGGSFLENFQKNNPGKALYRNPLDGRIRRVPQQGELDLGEAGAGHQLGMPLEATEKPAGAISTPQGIQVAQTTKTAVRPSLSDTEAFGPTTPTEAAVSKAKNAIADIIKSGEAPRLNMEEILTQTGDVRTASKVSAVKTLSDRIRAMDPIQDAKDLFEKIHSIYQPKAFYESLTSLSRDRSNVLADTAAERAETLIAAQSDKVRVPRLTSDAEAKAVEIADKEMMQEFGHISKSHIETVNLGADKDNNVVHVGFRLGKPDKTLFESDAEALKWASSKDLYGLYPGDYNISQKGAGFYIEIVRPVNETHPEVTKLLIPTRSEKSNLVGQVLQRIRSAEDVLSTFQRAQRRNATHGQQAMKDLANRQMTVISSLPNKSREMLEQVLEYNNAERKWFDKGVDFERYWQAKFGRNPTEQEISAYDQFVRLNDWDYMIREYGWYRDKTRQGFRNYRFNLLGPKDPESGVQTPIQTAWFEGRQTDKLDWGLTANEGIWYVDTKGVGKFYWKHDLHNSPEWDLIQAHIESGGAQIIERFSPFKNDLETFVGTKRPIHYVITDTPETKRILVGQNSDWMGGGHVIYQHPWYVKQHRITTGPDGRQSYYGDVTILNAITQKQAQDFARRINIAREFLRRGDDNSLDQFLKGNLPWNTADFKKMFNNDFLSQEHEVSVTFSGRGVFDSNPHMIEKVAGGDEGLKNQLKHPKNYEQSLDRTFLAERGQPLNTMVNKGTEANPMWVLEPARQLDPYTSLSRGLGNAIRSRYLTDYKVSAATQWVQQYYPLLGVSLQQAMKNPIHYLYHGELKPGLMGNATEDSVAGITAHALYVEARTSRANIKNFLGVQSENEAEVRRLEQTVMDAVYGEGGGKGAVQYAYDHQTLLSSIKDPAQFMRTVAFKAKLGFFNVQQLLVQSQSLTHVLGVAGPTEAKNGFVGYAISRRVSMREDDAVLDASDKIAQKWGWKPGQWKEAQQLLKSTGFDLVGGETAWRDNVMDPPVYKTFWGKWLDKGDIFFNEGERSVRSTAFFTAFSEWKKANPTRVIGDREAGEILNRADLLSVNMTRASKAAWESGILSIPTQFMTFNIRLAEQFLGKRLTGEEKRRAFLTYSLMYGVPTGLALPTAFMPFYEDMRKAAINNGVKLDDPFFKAWNDGLMGLLTEGVADVTAGKRKIEGQEFSRSYDVSRRFGPNPGDSVTKSIGAIFGGDPAPLAKLLVGASGSTVADIWNSTLPFGRFLGSVVTGREYKPHLEDLIQASSNITTLSTIGKMWYAFGTHQYMTRSERNIGDIDAFDSAMLAFGLQPKQYADMFIKKDWLTEVNKEQEKAQLQIAREIQRGMKASFQGERDTAAGYYRNAQSISTAMQLNYQQQQKALTTALEGWQSMFFRINQDFGPFSKKLPADLLKRYYDQQNNQ